MTNPSLAQARASYRATLASQGLRFVAKIVGIVVVARLVSPAEHGLFAMAASATLLLALLRDFGAGAAAIQSPRLEEGLKTALFWLHVGLGFALALCAIVVAPLVATFYREPAVGPLLILAAVPFVLNGVNAWPRTLLGRELRFVEINRIELIAALLGTLAMIGAAALGADAASFIWFSIVAEGVMTVGAWCACSWRPTQPADWRALLGLAGTGLNLTLHSVLTQLLAQVDTMAMGRWFGAAALGFYNRAGQLLMQPMMLVAGPFNQVLAATLAQVRRDHGELSPHVRETTTCIAHLTLPAVGLCIAVPDEIVAVVLGSAWPDAAPLLRWLAVAAGASLATTTLHPLCVAADCAQRLPAMSAANLLVLSLSLWTSRDSGPLGLVIAVAASSLVVVGPRILWATHGTGVPANEFVSALWSAMVQAALFGGAAWFTRNSLVLFAEIPPLASLGAAIVGGAIGYAVGAFAWTRTRKELHLVWQMLPLKRRD